MKNFGLEKNWKGTPVRELALTNERKEMLIITLWGKQAENFLAEMFSIIAIRRAIVTEYEGKKKLNCISGTLVWVKNLVSYILTKMNNNFFLRFALIFLKLSHYLTYFKI